MKITLSRANWESIGINAGWIREAKNIKNYVNQYKIQDSNLIFFLNKYESLIPWEQIETPEQVDQYIQETLIPELYEKINPESENNNYLKDIDLEKEFRNNPNDPQVQQAYQIYQQDPEKAKQTVLDHVNASKQKSFSEWWNYVTKENDVYAKSPAFQYSILKPIIDSSPETDKRSTMSLNAMALAPIHQKIQENPSSFKIEKMYQKSLENANLQSSNFKGNTETKDGWLVLPSKTKDPENFEENKKKLKDFSIPNGWCTGSGMEDQHLSGGDFHLLIEGGKAVVAIRMSGEYVAEVQGKGNQRPFQYWENILSYVDENELGRDNSHIKELESAVQLNKELEENPDSISSLGVNDLEKVSSENRVKFKEELITAWVKEISNNPRNYEDCPQEFKQDPRIQQAHLDAWVERIFENPSWYEKCPQELKQDPRTKELVETKVIPYWVKRIFENPYWYEKCPQELKQDPRIKELVETKVIPYWVKKISNNTDNYEDCPEELKQDPRIQQAGLDGWVKKISNNPSYYNNCPQELKQDPRIKEAYLNIDGWVKYISDDPSYYNNCPQELKQDARIQQAHLDGWVKYISEYPYYYKFCPQEFKQDPRIKEAVETKVIPYWVERISYYPSDYKYCPQEFKQDARIQQAGLDGWVKKISNNPHYYKNCPEELKQDPRIQQAHLDAWVEWISDDPSYYNNCTQEFKQDPRILALLPEEMKTQVTASRLFSSAFNDNYIGKIF